MEWYHAVLVVFGNAAFILPMFFWIRSEANSDRREFQKDMKEYAIKICLMEERYLQLISGNYPKIKESKQKGVK